MPRSGAGIYTLPPSNPVIPFTTIATAWANPTLQDIAEALTDSLSRTGLGGMLVPFKIADGTLPAPGLAFSNETGLGIRRVAAGVMSFVNSGDDILSILTDRVSSPMRMDIFNYLTHNAAGYTRWLQTNDLGTLVFWPSDTVDADDFNPAKGISFDPDGNVEIKGNLSVDGIVSGVFDLQGGSVADDIIVTNTVQSNIFTGNYITVLQNIITAKVEADPAIIDFQAGQSWLASLSAPLTITSITGLAAGNIGRITFTGTTNAITWPADVKWPGPSYTQPSLSAGPLDIAVVVLEYDGTNYLANASIY